MLRLLSDSKLRFLYGSARISYERFIDFQIAVALFKGAIALNPETISNPDLLRF